MNRLNRNKRLQRLGLLAVIGMVAIGRGSFGLPDASSRALLQTLSDLIVPPVGSEDEANEEPEQEGKAEAEEEAKRDTASRGFKIVAPSGGGIYLGSFADLGLVFQLAGHYDGSVLPSHEQPHYYGQSLDQMFGKKVVIRANSLSLPFLQDQGLVAEGKAAGRLFFGLASHQLAQEQYGYVTRYALGDEYNRQVFQDVVAGKLDAKIDALAKVIRQYPYPLFVNYWIEADGSVPVEEDGPALFIAAMRRIHDRIEAIAPNRVTWVAPTLGGGAAQFMLGGKDPYQLFYPGDQYVDWHGFSFFCWDGEGESGVPAGSYLSPKQCLANMRSHLQGLASKPVMFEQFGLRRDGVFRTRTDQDRAQWYKDFLREVKNYPEVAAILWSQGDSQGWNSALKVSEPATKVIRDEIAAHPNYWHDVLQTE